MNPVSNPLPIVLNPPYPPLNIPNILSHDYIMGTSNTRGWGGLILNIPNILSYDYIMGISNTRGWGGGGG